MKTYLVQFAQFHEEFRLAEFESLKKLENITVEYNPLEYKNNCPFLQIKVASDEDASKLIRRAILIKAIYELWGVGSNYQEVHESVKANPDRWPEYMEKSFKFTVHGFGKACSSEQQLKIINSFSYLKFRGKIDLRNPDVEFAVIEDYGLQTERDFDVLDPHTIYMGRLIASGNRELIAKFNVKKRRYIGNTTMDAELSLIMANQALASPGKLIYDPFVGTGSFLFTCAHFGAFTMGSDIDGRQIRGREDRGVRDNISQYQINGKVLDTLVFDLCHHPWREVPIFDGIVTAPYGVRAGAKKLGRKIPLKKPVQTEPAFPGDIPMHLREEYYPPTQPWEMSEVLKHLLEFAAKFLKVGGRLVYWLPTLPEEYTPEDVPLHPSMRLVANSEQSFGKWARRLITMEKVCPYIKPQSQCDLEQYKAASDKAEIDITDKIDALSLGEEQAAKTPGHYAFREKGIEKRVEVTDELCGKCKLKILVLFDVIEKELEGSLLIISG
ncbi:uncharacterized protein VTP21DRAFT_5904 [Calcarisporiella thermophila]|uniref:uncharacterized protein n=1 Tax=Calcarisporiella thermophila TaxID=911321 RepID=UPI003741FFD2